MRLVKFVDGRGIQRVTDLLIPEPDFGVGGSDQEVPWRAAESDPESSDAASGRPVRIRARFHKPATQRGASHA